MLHVWFRPCDLDAGRFTALVHDVRVLCSCLQAQQESGKSEGIEKLIAGPQGQGVPVLNDDLIHFSLDAREFSVRRSTRTRYEQLRMETNPLQWYAWKTERPHASSPYDLLVCAILIAVKEHFPEMILDSEMSHADWTPAVDWYRQCLPHRFILPGPWSAGVAHLHINDLALLDSQAQRVGYRVVLDAGVLFLVFGNDLRNTQDNNVVFDNDVRGKRELAGYLRYLSDAQFIIDTGSKEWRTWSKVPGRAARWTPHVYEYWQSHIDAFLDLRKLEVDDDIAAWIPRRGLAMFIEQPRDLQRYQFVLLTREHGQIWAVRIEERWSGYNDPGILSVSLSSRLPFFERFR